MSPSVFLNCCSFFNSLVNQKNNVSFYLPFFSGGSGRAAARSDSNLSSKSSRTVEWAEAKKKAQSIELQRKDITPNNI
eukprot:3609206-Amphidinium_carterae.2